MSMSLFDRVAIVGMGCTRFGEHFCLGADDLMIEAAHAALSDAGLQVDQVDAFWLGTQISGWAGVMLAKPLKVQYKPIMRVENFCATGTEAFRSACYAVAAGLCDVAMAVGVEKMKDSGFSGLELPAISAEGTGVDVTAPAAFAMMANAYFHKYGLDPQKGKDVLARIAWKNHRNGAKNPRAQYRKEVPLEAIMKSPLVAAPLGVMDCSGVADGSAAVIVVPAEEAYRYRSDPVFVKAVTSVAGPGAGTLDTEWDQTTIRETVTAARLAYAQAGISDPRRQLSLAEVHDCFTPTEMILMEDLGFSERGRGWQDVVDGVFDLDGELPVNPDGGLKSFGHPIGASGIRMLFEAYLQLRGQAGPRQIPGARTAMTHNLGGLPWECVTAVSILGREPGPI